MVQIAKCIMKCMLWLQIEKVRGQPSITSMNPKWRSPTAEVLLPGENADGGWIKNN